MLFKKYQFGFFFNWIYSFFSFQNFIYESLRYFNMLGLKLSGNIEMKIRHFQFWQNCIKTIEHEHGGLNSFNKDITTDLPQMNSNAYLMKIKKKPFQRQLPVLERLRQVLPGRILPILSGTSLSTAGWSPMTLTSMAE